MSKWQDRSGREQISLATHPKMKQHDAIDKLADALPEPLLKGFRYGELRGTVLVLHFTHPGHLNEFRIRKDEILEKMRVIYKEQELKGVISFKDVKAEQRYQPPPKEQSEQSLEFEDRSWGDFENTQTNPELHRIFESIRTKIKERRDDHSTD